MSLERVQRQRAKTVLLNLLRRIAKTGRKLRDMGRNPAQAVQVFQRSAAGADRARWRRWYKANQKYQRQLRAIRQRGGNVSNMPTSLPMYAVL